MRETEPQEDVQEVDCRDKVIHIKKSEFVIFKEEHFGAFGDQQDLALMTTDVRKNSIYIKSFAVDKLLAAAVPKP